MDATSVLQLQFIEVRSAQFAGLTFKQVLMSVTYMINSSTVAPQSLED